MLHDAEPTVLDDPDFLAALEKLDLPELPARDERYVDYRRPTIEEWERKRTGQSGNRGMGKTGDRRLGLFATASAVVGGMLVGVLTAVVVLHAYVARILEDVAR